MSQRDKKMKLSKRQKSMLEYIHRCVEKESRPPTIREIGGALDISSTSVVNYNLNRLEEKGLIEREASVSRGLRLTEASYQVLGTASSAVSRAMGSVQNLVRVPILGNIVASRPIEPVSSDNFMSYDEDDVVEISASMLPKKSAQVFALRVDGYSMIEDMIADGDLVILQKAEDASDGDVVAAWVEGEGLTLKRLYRDHNKGVVRLQPRNPTMEPILVDPDELQIQGKLIMTVSLSEVR